MGHFAGSKDPFYLG